MLITLNDGSYPQDNTEIKKMKSKIEQFLDSKTVEQVSDFDSQLISTNYFSEGAIYFYQSKKRVDSLIRQIHPLKTKQGFLFNFYCKFEFLCKS